MLTRWLENMGVCACCAALYLLAGPLREEVQHAYRDLSSLFERMAR